MLATLYAGLGILGGCKSLGTDLAGAGLGSLLGGSGLGGGDRPAKPEISAFPQIPLMDNWSPDGMVSGRKARRGPAGGFLIQSGVPYEFHLESYCMGVGQYSHPGGKGYAVAPMPSEGLVGKILAAAASHPEVKQSDIQYLIWNLLPNTPFHKLSESSKATVRRLLPPEVLADAGAEGMQAAAKDAAMQQASESLGSMLQARMQAAVPASVRKVQEAQNRVRQMMADANTSYEEIEAVAVQRGEPPSDPSDLPIPAGRWSLNPDGYLMRVDSFVFMKSTVQIFKPRPYRADRDELGRIWSVASDDGYRCETAYDDKVGAIDLPGYPQYVAYLLSRTKVTVPSAGGKAKTKTWKNVGWVLKRRRPGEAGRKLGMRPVQLADAAGVVDPAYLELAQQPSLWDRLTDWKETAEGAQERYETYRDLQHTASGQADSSAIDNLFDQEHYRDGMNAATRGSQDDRYGFIAEHHRRQAEAVTWSTSVLAGLPDTAEGVPSGGGGGAGSGGGWGGQSPTDPLNLPEWHPPDTAGRPGSAASQIRGISNRFAG